jgi:1,4-dihydroxy-2-naphthoyl-CoA hydrolase
MPEQPLTTMKGEIAFFIEECQEDHVTARMPVTPGMLNPIGIAHAGAPVWLADVMATVLARGMALG